MEKTRCLILYLTLEVEHKAGIVYDTPFIKKDVGVNNTVNFRNITHSQPLPDSLMT